MNKWKLLKSGSKSFLNDIKLVYPSTLKTMAMHQSISIQVMILIYLSFYLDNIVKIQFEQIHNNALDYIFSYGHWFGNGEATLYLFVLFFVGGLIFNKAKLYNNGLLVAESFLFSGFITILVKSIFGRWRPYTEHGSYSFFWFTFGPNDHLSLPSGHTTVAFALSSILAGTTENKYLKASYYLLATVTAFSRIYHKQHWFSDVFFSAIIGTLIGNVLIKMNNQRINIVKQ